MEKTENHKRKQWKERERGKAHLAFYVPMDQNQGGGGGPPLMSQGGGGGAPLEHKFLERLPKSTLSHFFFFFTASPAHTHRRSRCDKHYSDVRKWSSSSSSTYNRTSADKFSRIPLRAFVFSWKVMMIFQNFSGQHSILISPKLSTIVIKRWWWLSGNLLTGETTCSSLCRIVISEDPGSFCCRPQTLGSRWTGTDQNHQRSGRDIRGFLGRASPKSNCTLISSDEPRATVHHRNKYLSDKFKTTCISLLFAGKGIDLGQTTLFTPAPHSAGYQGKVLFWTRVRNTCGSWCSSGGVGSFRPRAWSSAKIRHTGGCYAFCCRITPQAMRVLSGPAEAAKNFSLNLD